jgi:hypothetical protein
MKLSRIIGILFLIAVAFIAILGFRYILKLGPSSQEYSAIVSRLTELNQRYPFAIPSDGRIDPDRLELWIDIHRESAEKNHLIFAPLINEEVSTLPGSYTYEFLRSLIQIFENHKMSPNESKWILRRLCSIVHSPQYKMNPENKDSIRWISEGALLNLKAADRDGQHAQNYPLNGALTTQTLEIISRHRRFLGTADFGSATWIEKVNIRNLD